MKLKVLKSFVDKLDHRTFYYPGNILDISDESRCADLVARGLCSSLKEDVGSELADSSLASADAVVDSPAEIPSKVRAKVKKPKVKK